MQDTKLKTKMRELNYCSCSFAKYAAAATSNAPGMTAMSADNGSMEDEVGPRYSNVGMGILHCI